MSAEPDPNFSGPEYEPERDHERLSKQHERIAALMLDGCWRTVAEIALATGAPENSVQAQLRHLRKPRFGGFIVTKRAPYIPTAHGGLWQYHVRRRTSADPPYVGGKSLKAVERRLETVETLLELALEAMDQSLDLTTRAAAIAIRKKLNDQIP